mgnify:CR=1 FL=1
MDPRHIRISDYNYELPDERIAKYPLAERDMSKLLVYDKGEVKEDSFKSLPYYLPSGSLMVFNNTKVIQARLYFRKATGATIEVFCMEPFAPVEYQMNFSSKGECQWLCMIGNLKRWKSGSLSRDVRVRGKKIIFTAERLNTDDQVGDGTKHIIRFSWDDSSVSFSEVLEATGEIPIPPYLNRRTEASDKKTYQTVYSKIKGSVAAPTAGLHFTDEVLQAIDSKGIEREELTLHVGAGTFKPVKSEEIEGHEMHSEYMVVKKETIEKLLAHECECTAVGTTSVRTLESLYYIGRKVHTDPTISEEDLHVGQWEPYDVPEEQSDAKDKEATKLYLKSLYDYMERHGIRALHTSTQIIIAPGFKYHIVKRMVTNFHQPQSTLLLLVSAFVNGDWHKIYDYALNNDFRFLSYGDSSLLIP